MCSSAYGLLRKGDKPQRSVVAGIFTLALGLSGVAHAGDEPLRLVALGDSLTQGYGLPQEEGLVPQLEAWLQAEGLDVIVINAGVSGDTTAGGRSRIDWTLADEPDAMMVALGGNDLLRGIDPATSRANLQAILERLTDEGVPAMLVGLPAPGNYGPEFRDAFEAMYLELSEDFDAPLYPNMLQPISDKYDLGLSYSELMQDDHLHPSAEGVAAIVEGMGPFIATWLEGIQDERPDS